MRALVPLTKCDKCDADLPADVRSSKARLEWPDGSVTAFAGESCPNCLEKLKAVAVELFGEYLVPDPGQVKRTKPATGAKPMRDDPTIDPALRKCNICGTTREFPDAYVAPTRGALGQHLTAKHNTTLAKQGLALPGGRRL